MGQRNDATTCIIPESSENHSFSSKLNGDEELGLYCSWTKIIQKGKDLGQKDL